MLAVAKGELLGFHLVDLKVFELADELVCSMVVLSVGLKVDG